MKAKFYNFVLIRIILFLIFSLYFLVVFGQPDYTFKGAVMTTGPALSVGAVYRFNNVKPGIDARVSITAMTGGITVTSIDENWTGFDEAFQPFINVPSLSDGYVEFNIEFVLGGTNTPSIQTLVSATCIDVDGVNYGNGKIYEKDQIQKINGYYDFGTIANSITVLDTGGVGSWVIGENFTGLSYPGIDTVQKDVMFTVVNAGISSFKVRIGSRNTSPTKGEIRYRSVYFKKFKYPWSILAGPKIISFKGNRYDEKINLDWELANSNLINKTELESSLGNNDFKTIAVYIPLENEVLKVANKFSANQDQPIIYYRLKITDNSGKVEYSDVLCFKMNKSLTENSMKVFPTRVTGGQFTIMLDAVENMGTAIQMFDYSGNIVYHKNTLVEKGKNNLLINDFNNSLKGNFVVIARSGHQTSSGKIFIQ